MSEEEFGGVAVNFWWPVGKNVVEAHHIGGY